MEFKTLTIGEAAKKMDSWKEDSAYYLSHEIDSDYMDIRNRLIESFESVQSGQKYVTDYKFGFALVKELSKEGFGTREAANDDIWRFLSLCVIPDIVAKRWGKAAEIRYYKQSGRIWLKTIWWYIYLSWNGSEADTRKIIEKNSTDQILQLVDRVGKKGYFVSAYRKIMYYYWMAREKDPSVGEDQFRRVMTLHTALCKSVDPEFVGNGPDDYAKMLFHSIGVEV